MTVTFGGKILWDPVASAVSYVAQSKNNGGSILNTVPTANTEVPVQDLVAGAGLNPGDTFRVEVASVDSFGNQGSFSALVTFTLQAPPAPENIRAEG